MSMFWCWCEQNPWYKRICIWLPIFDCFKYSKLISHWNWFYWSFLNTASLATHRLWFTINRNNKLKCVILQKKKIGDIANINQSIISFTSIFINTSFHIWTSWMNILQVIGMKCCMFFSLICFFSHNSVLFRKSEITDQCTDRR